MRDRACGMLCNEQTREGVAPEFCSGKTEKWRGTGKGKGKGKEKGEGRLVRRVPGDGEHQ